MTKASLIKTMAMTLLVSAALTGCSDNDRDDVTAIPFKSSEDGKWGMMTTEGKVLFENEFRNPPTFIADERFFVQNQDGFWEMFSAEESPRRIGDEFRFASAFSNGVAMVTPRDGHISIIDKDGKIVTELDEFEGKKVSWATGFTGRNAIVACDTVRGVVNTKGAPVLQPEYSTIELLPNGLIVASDYKFDSTHIPYDSVAPAGSLTIMDNKGKELFSVDSKKYWGVVSSGVTDKYITLKSGKLVNKTSGEGESEFTYPEMEWKYIILDYNGNDIVKTNDKIDQILAVRGEQFIFTNEDNLCGVRNMEGDVIVKPDYDGINFIGTDYIALYKNGDEDNDYKSIVKVVNNEGTKIGNETFRAVAGNDNYRSLAGNNLFVQEDDDEWTVFDKDGKELNDLPKIFDMLPYSNGDTEIRTDVVNYDNLFKKLKITPTEYDGYTFSTTPQEAIMIQQSKWAFNSDQERPKASDYSWMNTIWNYGDIDGLSYTGEVVFPQNLSKQTYRNNKVIDYRYGNMYWYHIEHIPAGYVFNNITPSEFKLTFNSYAFYGKLRTLYKKLVEYTKKWGTVEDSNPGATLLDLGSGRKLLITLSEKEVVMKWGKLSDSDKWIGIYSSNSEKLEPSYTGNPYTILETNNPYTDGEGDYYEAEGDI